MHRQRLQRNLRSGDARRPANPQRSKPVATKIKAAPPGCLFSCMKKFAMYLLASNFLVVDAWARTPRRAPAAIAKLSNIDLQFVEGAAESVAVHAKLARGAALVPLVLLEHSRNEGALKFAHSFRVENVAAIHVLYECFQLVFHGFLFSMIALFLARGQRRTSNYFVSERFDCWDLRT